MNDPISAGHACTSRTCGTPSGVLRTIWTAAPAAKKPGHHAASWGKTDPHSQIRTEHGQLVQDQAVAILPRIARRIFCEVYWWRRTLPHGRPGLCRTDKETPREPHLSAEIWTDSSSSSGACCPESCPAPNAREERSLVGSSRMSIPLLADRLWVRSLARPPILIWRDGSNSESRIRLGNCHGAHLCCLPILCFPNPAELILRSSTVGPQQHSLCNW